MNDDPREFVFTRYDARHGMAWLAQAYALFSRKRLPWVLLLLTYYILLQADALRAVGRRRMPSRS